MTTISARIPTLRQMPNSLTKNLISIKIHPPFSGKSGVIYMCQDFQSHSFPFISSHTKQHVKLTDVANYFFKSDDFNFNALTYYKHAGLNHKQFDSLLGFVILSNLPKAVN